MSGQSQPRAVEHLAQGAADKVPLLPAEPMKFKRTLASPGLVEAPRIVEAQKPVRDSRSGGIRG